MSLMKFFISKLTIIGKNVLTFQEFVFAKRSKKASHQNISSDSMMFVFS